MVVFCLPIVLLRVAHMHHMGRETVFRWLFGSILKDLWSVEVVWVDGFVFVVCCVWFLIT